MRLSGRNNVGRSTAGRRRVGLALLFFIAHAFVVGATHLHRLDFAAQVRPDVHASLGADAARDDGADAGGHAQCLLCRLQRNLVADLAAPGLPVAAPLTQFVGSSVRPLRPFSDATLLSPPGRAPPLA